MQTKSFDERKAESSRIKQKYPTRIPVIVDVASGSNVVLTKNKFLIESDLTLGHLIYAIRKRVQLQPESAIFAYLENNIIGTPSELMGSVYRNSANADGFLYVTISLESTFG